MQTKPDLAAKAPAIGRYEVDAGGDGVAFRTRHMFGLAAVRGTFTIRTATIDIAEPFTDSSIHAEIETASFSTGNPARDGKVRSARFLDADRYPVMTFRSESIYESTIVGSLTVRNVTRPVRLSIEHLAVSARTFRVRATTRIDRTELGITAMRGLAGRYLAVTLDIQCTHA